MKINSVFACAWFALLMLVAEYIRVYGSDVYHYHVDELMHMKIAEGATFRQMLQYSLFEAHPPLGHILRYGWIKISETVWFSRSLSLVFGMAMIPLYYAIGKKLNGELTGMCAAVLVAFSRGCIIQSYVVRNYSMFLFFLSAGFYFYLLWRDERANLKLLAGYVVCGMCACLTHFSGIFAIFVIAACEVMRLYLQKCDVGKYVRWVVANVAIGLVAVAAFLIWHTTLGPIESYAAHASASYTLSETAVLPLLYFMHVANYIFIRPAFIYVLAIAIPIAVARKDASVPYLVLAAASLLFGVILFLTGIYPFVGDRHGLWLLPFFIPPAAWVLVDALLHITKKPIFVAMLIFAGGVAFYDAEDRFSDSMEYKITESQWQDISGYLDGLDDKMLLVSGKTDAIMMAPPGVNIYADIKNPQYVASPLSALVPYYHTHLLFDKTYRTYTGNMISILQSAYSSRLLDNYDRLIFISSFVPSDIFSDLILCPTLDKKLVSFPAAEPGHVFIREDLRKYSVIFMEVNKQDFLRQFLAPDGKARECLRK